jgi:hypothetical protein
MEPVLVTSLAAISVASGWPGIVGRHTSTTAAASKLSTPVAAISLKVLSFIGSGAYVMWNSRVFATVEGVG